MSRFKRMHVWRFALALAAIVPSAGAASTSCEDIQALETFAESGLAPKGAACSTFLDQSGRTGVSCHWEFPFRDDAAAQFAASLWSRLKDCRAGVPSGPDNRVNHPDSYDLRSWIVGDNTYYVSVKDKGGNQLTRVFLRYR